MVVNFTAEFDASVDGMPIESGWKYGTNLDADPAAPSTVFVDFVRDGESFVLEGGRVGCAQLKGIDREDDIFNVIWSPADGGFYYSIHRLCVAGDQTIESDSD